jgi:hypothetical protein
MKGSLRAAALFGVACLIWVLALGPIGLERAARHAEGGVLSYTFEAWERLPMSRHLFLAQYEPGEFEQNLAYNSYAYPFLLAQFAIAAPLRAAGLPWDLAHNVLPFAYVGLMAFALFRVTRPQAPRTLAGVATLVAAAGLVATTPAAWVSLLRYNRDNFHLPVAILFCALSTLVYRGSSPSPAIWRAGIVIALFCPVYAPAWLLAVVFLSDSLPSSREVAKRCAAVGVLAAVSFVLPLIACKVGDLAPVGSSYFYRSGLDGSTKYLSSIPQAVLWPIVNRRWPVALPLILMGLAAIGVSVQGGMEAARRVRRQVLFCLIPYASKAVLFPQFVSIHPYMADMLLLIPAAFLPAFWLLETKPLAEATGETRALWITGTALAIMSNALTIAQTFPPR